MVVLTRGASRDLPHACAECGAGGKLHLETWTPDRAGAWMTAIDGADAVVQLAGAGVLDERWSAARKALLRSSRIDSTRLLAEAIDRATKKPSVFVTASGIGHYGLETGDAIVTEDSGAGGDFLATLTKDWEAAGDRAAAAGVRVCHPRFGIILGRGGGFLGKLEPIFRACVGGPIGDGKQYLPWVHVRDTVRAVEAMLDRPDLSGAYNVVAPEPVTMNVFARALGEALHRPALMRVPSFAIKAAMGSEAAEVALTGQRAIPKRLVDAGFAFVFPDLRSALADLVD